MMFLLPVKSLKHILNSQGQAIFFTKRLKGKMQLKLKTALSFQRTIKQERFLFSSLYLHLQRVNRFGGSDK